MNWEERSNAYLQQLKTDGVILMGNLTGLHEINGTSEAKASFMINGELKEKRIVLYVDANDVFNWTYYTPTDNVLRYTMSNQDWLYPQLSKRIVAPIQLIMDDTGIKMYGWFQLNNLPIVPLNTVVHLYCNVVLPEHDAVIDAYGGIITIEDNPN